MSEKSGSAERLTKLEQNNAKVEKVRKALDAKLDGVFKKARAAIDGDDRTMMEFYASDLEGEVGKISAVIRDLDSSVIELKELEFDEDFVAEHEAAVEKAATFVSESRTSLTKQFQTAKRLQNECEKAFVGADTNEEQVLRNLAALDKDLKEALDGVVALSKKVDAVWTKATQAVEARNAKGLADAQKAFDGLNVDTELLSFNTYSKLLDEFKTDDPAFSDSLKADLKDGVKDLRGRVRAQSSYATLIRRAKSEIPTMKVEEIDVGKALGVLELDRKFEKKLAAALNGPAAQLEAALGKLTKEAKSELSGKDAKAALKNAGVI